MRWFHLARSLFLVSLLAALVTAITQPAAASVQASNDCYAVPAYAARLDRFWVRDLGPVNLQHMKQAGSIQGMSPYAMLELADGLDRYRATLTRMAAKHMVPDVAWDYHSATIIFFTTNAKDLRAYASGQDTSLTQSTYARWGVQAASTQGRQTCGAYWPFPVS